MPSYYNQKNLSLPLDLILLENGYSYKKEKCSRNHLTMKNENEDLIIITRSINGHYLYFNPLNDYDKGNIYSFCKNRGVKLDDLLDKDKIKSLDIKDLKHSIKPSELDKRSIEILNIFKEELQDLAYDKPHFFGAKRLIDDESLKGFHLIKQDNYHNICIPTYTFKEYKNLQTSEGNVISFNQCGFMKYLQYSIYKKDENTFIKQLCYGKKGLEILKSKDTS